MNLNVLNPFGALSAMVPVAAGDQLRMTLAGFGFGFGSICFCEETQ